MQHPMTTHRPLPYVLEDRTGQSSTTDFDDIYDRLFLRVSSYPPRSASIPIALSPSFSSSPTSTPSSYPWMSSSPGSALSISPSSSGSSSSSSTLHAYMHAFPVQPQTIAIYDMPHRWSPRRTDAHISRSPSVVLSFSSSGLGSVAFAPASRPARVLGLGEVGMGKWLVKTGLFAGNMSRSFAASDGRRYQWSYRPQGKGHEWVCEDAELGYEAATYDAPITQTGHGGGMKKGVLEIGEEYGEIAVELLASLLIMRYIREHRLRRRFPDYPQEKKIWSSFTRTGC